MSARLVSAPPQLPGFEFIQLIGSGGYADVYLYQQVSPRRQVAIKIVDPSVLDSASASDYTEEANVMAMVSAHPHIVQVFQASVSPDGRPYLVMEYYPNQNFYERARGEQMPVAEVLRVGIQIASAVETAHRAGILHRDIKPANILTSEFDHPGLTDFGIAAVAGRVDHSGDGLSIPWSPPEALGEASTLVQSDVYSLAATIYTMLAGRAPFEAAGGDNRPLAMMKRIEHDPLPSINRPDVPPMLERVLAVAMSKQPSARPATAADLARQLQEVESSMQLPVTPLQLRGDSPTPRTRTLGDLDGESTRVKRVTSVEAQPASAPPQSAPRAAPSSAPYGYIVRPAPPSSPPAATADHRQSVNPVDELRTSEPTVAPAAPSYEPVMPEREGFLFEPDVADTMDRPEESAADLAEYQAPRAIPKLWWGVAAAAILALIMIGAAQLFGSGGKPEEPMVDPAEVEIAEVNDNLNQTNAVPAAVKPPQLAKVQAEVGDYGNDFTWDDPGGVTFSVTVDGESRSQEIDKPEFSTSAECIEVAVITPSGLMSDPTRGCV